MIIARRGKFIRMTYLHSLWQMSHTCRQFGGGTCGSRSSLNLMQNGRGETKVPPHNLGKPAS